jgi:tetratricopeptide (TPR) repeat protein
MPRCCVAIALFVLAGPMVRADDWPVPVGPSQEPKPFHYDAKYLREVPKDFLEDAAACILFTRSSYLVEPDGTIVSTTHEITRFNGRKGIEKLGEYRSIYFNPRYEKLTLNEARVLKADGTMVMVQPRHVQLRDVATDYQVYDDDKQLVISWPNLQVGDAYEVKWTVRSKNPEFGGEFFTRYTFGDDDFPVVRDELYVRVPAGKPLRFATVNGDVKLARSQGRGGTEFHWQVVNKTPLPRDDDRPSREEMRLQVACSTFPSWEAIGKWKQRVRAECWEASAAVKEVAAKVAGPQRTPVEKARALTHWVRQNIRYLSRGPEGMGYTPHPPASVLTNRFGDCKDQAQLLSVLLREAGVPVWLATLGTRDDGQVLENVPSPWGTHAIVVAEIGGKEYWIDTTISQAAWDFLPRSDCDRVAYLTRDGEARLARTPSFTAMHHRIEQTTHVTIAPDGTSRNRRSVSYHGSSAWTRRDAWIDTPLGERRRLVSAELQDVNSRTRLLTLRVDDKNLRDYDSPVRAEMEFEVAQQFGADGHEGALCDNTIWSRLLAYTLDAGREVPFELPTPFESTHRFVVQMPPSLICSLPPDEKRIESPWGLYEVTVQADPRDAHRLEVHIHTRLDKTRVEPHQFAAYQRFHDDVTKAYRAWLTLGPTSDIADAPALEALLTSSPAVEPNSAKVLARLYLDNHRAADARRVLAMAVKHHPNDRAIWELRIQAADDFAEKEKLYSEAIKQFPDDPQYVVALRAARASAHVQLARMCEQQGRLQEALKHLATAIEMDEGHATHVQVIEFKAQVCDRLGDEKRAIEAYRLALQVDGKAHRVLPRLARLEWQAGLKAEARGHLRQYTATIGKEAAELCVAADLHLLMERPDDALELVGQLKERCADADRIAGLVYLGRRDYTRAVDSLERVHQHPRAAAGLVEAYIALGDLESAERATVGVVRSESVLENQHFDRRKAQLQVLLKRRDDLLASIGYVKHEGPSLLVDVSAYVCAEHGLQQGWPREHVENLLGPLPRERARVMRNRNGDQIITIPIAGSINTQPSATTATFELQFGPALALRGWLALEKGQLSKALADAEKAIAMKPADARAYLVRGRVRLERGDAKAQGDLQEAARLGDGKDAIVLHWLAAAQAHGGRLDLAVQTQRQAVALRPNDAELSEQLRSFEARNKQALD